MKNTPGDIIFLRKCTKNHDHMLYCSWDMAPETCNGCFSFLANFCPFTPASPVTAQKVKISKKRKKKTPRHIIFNISLPKIMIICFTYCSWDMVPYRCNCYLSFGAIFFCLFTPLTSLSNSRQHLANANIIADVKSKIITPSWHFLVDMIFSATSKVQNYQNKTEVKSLSPSKHMLATYFKEF